MPREPKAQISAQPGTRDAPPGKSTICPLCGGASPKDLVQTWKEYHVLDCRDCGLAFAHPFKNPGPEYYVQYEDIYRPQAQQGTDPMSFEYDECLAAIRGDAGKTLLDVGCGAGGFLNRARGQGLKVSGVDFDQTRLDKVRQELGIESVYAMTLPDFAREYRGEKFDVVTFFQVMEHLDNPGEWLASIAKLLKPGGRLFIGVPNRDRTFDPFREESMLEVDNPPHHLTRWRAEPMRRFVERQGFRVKDVRPLGVPRPLLALLLRNRLRFGMATRTLRVDQIQHLPRAAGGAPGPRERLVLGLVALKEAAINALSYLLYPFFRVAYAVFGWQGVVLFCVAEPKPSPER